MSKKKLILETEKIEYGRGHKKPKSRRDFLAQGAISGVGTVMAPSLLSMISQQAMGLTAADCKVEDVAGAPKPVPFVVMDLSGGSNIPGGNVMVGKGGGQRDYLSNYSTLSLIGGVNDARTTTLNGKADGLVFLNDSQLLRGILDTVSATTRENLDGAIFCTKSLDDTNVNPHNPSYWINKSGLNGALVPLVGTRNSPSGGRQAAPATSINPATSPVQITRPESTGNLVDLGLLASLLNPAKAESVMKAVSAMSQTQINKFNNLQMNDKVKELVSCGYITSSTMGSEFSAERLDPRLDTAIQTAFSNNFGGNNAKSSAVAKLVLDGLAGVGTIELTGYDYHGSSNATKRNKDLAAGQQLGQIFEAAALKGTAVVVYLVTDGGVAFNTREQVNDRYGLGSDNSSRSSSVMFIYDPKGAPKIRNAKRQIGEFSDAGAVNTRATSISNSVVNLAKLIVANYLALNGREGELAKVVGDNPFGGDLEKMLSFSADTLNK